MHFLNFVVILPCGNVGFYGSDPKWEVYLRPGNFPTSVGVRWRQCRAPLRMREPRMKQASERGFGRQVRGRNACVLPCRASACLETEGQTTCLAVKFAISSRHGPLILSSWLPPASNRNGEQKGNSS